MMSMQKVHRLSWAFSAAALLLCTLPELATAKATPEEITRLGKQLTCMGAEKTGTASGVAEYTGKWLGAAPGMTGEIGRISGDPYSSEKPLFTITAQNYTQYADRL